MRHKQLFITLSSLKATRGDMSDSWPQVGKKIGMFDEFGYILSLKCCN